MINRKAIAELVSNSQFYDITGSTEILLEISNSGTEESTAEPDSGRKSQAERCFFK